MSGERGPLNCRCGEQLADVESYATGGQAPLEIAPARRRPDDVAAAGLFDPVLARLTELTADDPDGVALIESGEVRHVARMLIARQEMVAQGMHRIEATIVGTRARYGDDASSTSAVQKEN